MFGSGAKIPYVECYPDGYRTGIKARTQRYPPAPRAAARRAAPRTRTRSERNL